MTMNRREIFFATCAPGVEPALHRELSALRMAKIERQVGGVYFEGTIRDGWRANLWLRTAIRVLLRVARFDAPDSDALYEAAKAVEWSRFLRPTGTLRVEGHVTQSQLNNGMFVAQRVKDAIVDRFREAVGLRPTVARDSTSIPDALIHAHVFRDRCTLSVDMAGDSLHKRGWRRFQGRAPLAETTAAAMLVLSQWDFNAPLIDLFCGSGTILVEAALMAGNIAPGLFRDRFAFENWSDHDADKWADMRHAATQAVSIPPRLRLIGRDLDPHAIIGARENFAAAGLSGMDAFAVGDALDYEFRPGWNGWIVSNLPYGVRVGAPPTSAAESRPSSDDEALDHLHAEFGAHLRARAHGYHAALLVGNSRLTKWLNLPGSTIHPLTNGGLDCDLILATIP